MDNTLFQLVEAVVQLNRAVGTLTQQTQDDAAELDRRQERITELEAAIARLREPTTA